MEDKQRILANLEPSDSSWYWDVTQMPRPVLEDMFPRGYFDQPHSVGRDRLIQKYIRWAGYEARFFLTIGALNRRIVFACRDADVLYMRDFIDSAGLGNHATGGLISEIDVGMVTTNLMHRVLAWETDPQRGRYTNLRAAILWSEISEKTARLLSEWHNQRVLMPAFPKETGQGAAGKYDFPDLVTIGVVNLMTQAGMHHRHFSKLGPVAIEQTEPPEESEPADGGGEV